MYSNAEYDDNFRTVDRTTVPYVSQRLVPGVLPRPLGCAPKCWYKGLRAQGMPRNGLAPAIGTSARGWLKMRKQLDRFLLRRGSLVLMWLLIAETLASPVADRYPHIGAAMALIIVLSVLLEIGRAHV